MDSSSSSADAGGSISARLRRPVQVLVVSSVMFTFISYWRTAAVVLCDLASTAYYIGGIVESAIGPAAPWFILAVMLFSYAVRSIYIESCSLFVRGGAYRVVKEAMGGFLAKLSVSALMFDFVLTGPISGVSAGQYIMGLVLDGLRLINPDLPLGPELADPLRRWGAVAIACAITFYFFRQNVLGIHESSGKALKIMAVTTVMAGIILIWCGLTLLVQGPANRVPMTPDLSVKVEYEEVQTVAGAAGAEERVWKQDPATGRLVPQMKADAQGVPRPEPRLNPVTGRPEDPLGWIDSLAPGLAAHIRNPKSWLSLFGVIGLLLAFGHSILAMSGEETLAQVYREVESPKLTNFKKAALVVFLYSLVLTAGISFLAVLLIPDNVRMKQYADNLIGGLAMHVIGPPILRLVLNGFVVVMGFLILSGAVNTAIIGSNGVLNRVAEDGVLPDWFLKPHRRYGTTYRVLLLIVGLQLFTIVASRGNMYVLGEAYAFGVVWSFVFTALAMVVLRFKDRSPREFKVPLNIRVRGVELPIGVSLIFLVLAVTALLNLLTKEVATVAGSAFTAVFLGVFMLSERYHEKRRGTAAHRHVEQFNQQSVDEISPVALRLAKPYRKLVAIRSPQNLFMLEKALSETDPDTTDVVVMTARLMPRGDTAAARLDLDQYDRELMTAVVTRAEKAGKPVQPLILATNNPLYAVINTAKDIRAQELVLGTSNIYTADQQVDQIAFYWIDIHGGEPQPLTVRLLSQSRDISFDLAGGNRIPKIGERKARSVAELRLAGVGVRHVLLVHDGTPEGSDLFVAVLTMLDPQVALTVVPVGANPFALPDPSRVEDDMERAVQLRREIELRRIPADNPAAHLIDLAGQIHCDLIVLTMVEEPRHGEPVLLDVDLLLRSAPCRVCLVASPRVPDEVAG